VLRTFSPQGQQDSQTVLGAPSGNRTRDRSTQFLTDSALARKAAWTNSVRGQNFRLFKLLAKCINSQQI